MERPREGLLVLYKHMTNMAQDRISLQNMEKKVNKTFKDGRNKQLKCNHHWKKKDNDTLYQYPKGVILRQNGW